MRNGTRDKNRSFNHLFHPWLYRSSWVREINHRNPLQARHYRVRVRSRDRLFGIPERGLGLGYSVASENTQNTRHLDVNDGFSGIRHFWMEERWRRRKHDLPSEYYWTFCTDRGRGKILILHDKRIRRRIVKFMKMYEYVEIRFFRFGIIGHKYV